MRVFLSTDGSHIKICIYIYIYLEPLCASFLKAVLKNSILMLNYRCYTVFGIQIPYFGKDPYFEWWYSFNILQLIC